MGRFRALYGLQVSGHPGASQVDPATERRKPCLCHVGAACARVRNRFLLWESAGPKFFPSHATRDVFNRGDSEPAGLVFAYRLPE